MKCLLRVLAPLVVAALGACGGNGEAAAAKGGGKRDGGPVPVTVAIAETRSVPISLEAVGNVEPHATVAVKSRVDGQITEVLVADGQDVARDQVLLKVDSRPFQLQLQEAQANLARDQALVASARSQETRYRELLEKGYVTKDNYADVKAKLDTAIAAVGTDEAAIGNAKLQIEYATLPIGGRIGKVALQRGNLVRAGDAEPIVVINQVNPIDVSFSAPEKSLADIRAAMRRGTLPVFAQRPDTEAVKGKLAFVDNAVDATTGTIKLRALFDNPKSALWPGQFVNVSLQLGEQAAALVVPPEALQTGPASTYVYVIGADSTATARTVKVARATPDAAVIAEGLQAGEQVVVDGQSRLADGSKVTVKTAAAAQDPAQ